MAAPKGNHNATKRNRRVQVGVRLDKNEKLLLQKMYGGVTAGIKQLISSEIENRELAKSNIKQRLLTVNFTGRGKLVLRPVKSQMIKPYFTDGRTTLYCGDAFEVLSQLKPETVDCCITSPPYYGQRDYGISTQIGLEPHPAEYLSNLLRVFIELYKVIKPSGNLWVNLGDTYWSGKGRSGGTDKKQKNRRFNRPQDLVGERPWCSPKQLLLIPHRFAILLQEYGWIIRNDNVWNKPDPIPDPVSDRCARVHEYIFHCVKQKRYYYDSTIVAVPTSSTTSVRETKPYPSVWNVSVNGSAIGKQHIAVFPKSLTVMPMKATCPSGGVFLDPFCGSGTSLLVARDVGNASCIIGIDADEYALKEAKKLIQRNIHP